MENHDDERPFYADDTLVVAWGSDGPFAKRLGDLEVGDLVCTGDASLPGFANARVTAVQRRNKSCFVVRPRGIPMNYERVFDLGGMVVAKGARVLSSAPLVEQRELKKLTCDGVQLEGGKGVHYVDDQGKKQRKNLAHSFLAGVQGEGGVGGDAVWTVAARIVKARLGEMWDVEVDKNGRERMHIKICSPSGERERMIVRRDTSKTTFGTDAFVEDDDGERRFLFTQEDLDAAVNEFIESQHVASVWMCVRNAANLVRDAIENGATMLVEAVERNQDGRPSVVNVEEDIDDAGAKNMRVYMGDSACGIIMHIPGFEVPWAMPIFERRPLWREPLEEGCALEEAFEDAFAWAAGLHLADGTRNTPDFSIGLTASAPPDFRDFLDEKRFLRDDAEDAEYVHVLRGLQNFIDAAGAVGYQLDMRLRDDRRKARKSPGLCVLVAITGGLLRIYEEQGLDSLMREKRIDAEQLDLMLGWRRSRREGLLAGLIDGDGCADRTFRRETQNVIIFTQCHPEHDCIVGCFATLCASLGMDCRVGFYAAEVILPNGTAEEQAARRAMPPAKRIRNARCEASTYHLLRHVARVQGPRIEDLPIRMPHKRVQNRDLARTCRGVGTFAYDFEDGGDRDTTYVELEDSKTMLTASGVILGVGQTFEPNVKTS
jgi:hypothetical protein